MMTPSDMADPQATRQFLEAYRLNRYQSQVDYYADRAREYTNAQRQAIWVSIGLVFLTALAGALEGIASGTFLTVLLLMAAICPIFSTALAGYTALHGFTQQAKLYRDARYNLLPIRAPKMDTDQSEDEKRAAVEAYVQQVEEILNREHSFWGQLAEGMTPAGT